MPSPSESTATSDATPIVTPSVERKVRSGFSRSVARPTRRAAEAGAGMGGRGGEGAQRGLSRRREADAGRGGGGSGRGAAGCRGGGRRPYPHAPVGVSGRAFLCSAGGTADLRGSARIDRVQRKAPLASALG